MTKEFLSTLTGYFPRGYEDWDELKMEGGPVDRVGNPLFTLQSHVRGIVPYASVAMDLEAFEYGTILRIPHLDEMYGKNLEFRVVDTGSAFEGEGLGRMDICTKTEEDSLNLAVNGEASVVAMGLPMKR